ncbi:hypothetical protein DL769_001226 [Monosporascus sp. CRB-8-3]|nr:hypothetical protein DL769_001226 [Monosporascus sp. CRB-8-3]
MMCSWASTAHDHLADLFESVEGSVITIAACIPLLQPLLERVRKRSWSSKENTQTSYLTPGSGSGRRQGYADIELSDKSRIRKARRKFEMESVLATKNDEVAGVVPTPAGSQDRILEEDEAGLATQTAGAQKEGISTPPKPHQGIYRTDEIRISYAKDGEGGASRHRHQDSWS